MRWTRAIAVVVFAPVLLAVGIRPGDQTEGVFAYVHPPATTVVERVAIERRAAETAAEAQRAEEWAVTVLLLIELARGSEDVISRGVALDAALVELTRADSRELIARLEGARLQSLRSVLEEVDPQDPIGMRAYARGLAQRRLDVLREQVLESRDPFAALDTLLADHGWPARGESGPLDRQRVRDRADYRAANRHEVFEFEGMARWHMLLPPTEALQGVPVEELDRKWQRARNLMVHLDRTWTHQDGPRIHDFLLDLMLRDNTGVVRLVHGDTQRLAQIDRERRWRLREAIWRLRHE
ncbi:hypothetical protein AY599_28010 [Leptolyngbya valderiana BDU 20041]|nr:hypothetical protein AY599_28010 [Leptolyngbya valderiana BDU 20041]